MQERQERYDAKLVQILENACRVFAAKGYHHATVRDVATATGVSPAGLYYYFRSKEELLFLILDHCLEELWDRVNDEVQGVEDAEGRIAAIVRAHLSYFDGHRDEMRVLAQDREALTGGFADGIRKRRWPYLTLVVRTLRALEPGVSRKMLRAHAMSLSGMLGWVYQWHRPGRDLPAGELAEAFSRGFLRGFRAGGRPSTLEAGGWRGDGTQATAPAEAPAPFVLAGPGF